MDKGRPRDKCTYEIHTMNPPRLGVQGSPEGASRARISTSSVIITVLTFPLRSIPSSSSSCLSSMMMTGAVVAGSAEVIFDIIFYSAHHHHDKLIIMNAIVNLIPVP